MTPRRRDLLLRHMERTSYGLDAQSARLRVYGYTESADLLDDAATLVRQARAQFRRQGREDVKER